MKTKLLILLTLTFTCTLHAYAGSATWNLNPVSGDWYTPANWTPETVPSGELDTATFSFSNVTDLFVNADIAVAEVFFDAQASAYEISFQGFNTFTFSGTGLVNDSVNAQAFLLDLNTTLQFSNTASAGRLTEITINGGVTNFNDHSTADHAQFVVGGLDVPEVFANTVYFNDESTAADGNFIINPDANARLKNGGYVWIDTNADAGRATFTCKAGQVRGANGGFVTLLGQGARATFICEGSNVAGAGAGGMSISGQAGSASYTATGGTNGGAGGDLFLTGSVHGQTARFIVLGNATMEIVTSDQKALTIGSLEGDGLVYLTTLVKFGQRFLIVGTNNLDTTFSGVMTDGVDSGARPGFLAKVGTGTFTLSGANTYHGGTTIREGTLVVTTPGASATGSGPVHVEGGTLAGTGIIGGALRVGIGTGTAFLSPGVDGIGTLSIGAGITFAADGVYQCELNSDQAKADDVNAKEVTIQSGATFTFVPLGTSTLQIGATFTVLEKRDPGAINGSFQNLPDGVIFTAGGNNFQASYSGGDGNDLTLTVVP